MLQIRNVTGTAFVVAESRAEENHPASPLYRDAYVNLILREASQQTAARVASGFPAMREMVKIRTKYFVRYFEIDNAATLSLKQRCFDAQGIHPNVRFIAGNYVNGLIALLSGNGVDPELPTYFIWDGNTMYLPMESDKAIMEQLRDNLQDFHLSFDYFATAVITKTTGELGLTRMADGFANMGAPWVAGFDDIRALAKDLKLRVMDNFTSGDLYRRYRPQASPDEPVFGPFYSVCTLGSR